MTLFLDYILSCAFYLLLCWMPYRLLLQSKATPGNSRLIILIIYGMMFFVPLLADIIPDIHNTPAIEFGPVFATFLSDSSEMKTGTEGIKISLSEIIMTVYITGLSVMLLITSINFYRLIKISASSFSQSLFKKKVYIHNEKRWPSYAWLGRIYLHKEMLDLPGEDLQTLLIHEDSHIRRYHFIDLLVSRFVLIFQWFNPAAWLLNAELERIHEYEADADVLAEGTDERKYQNFLIDNISRNQYSGLTDGLTNCSLKNRIVMMQTKRFKKGFWLRTGLVLLAGVTGGVFIHSTASADLIKENGKKTPYKVMRSLKTEEISQSETSKENESIYTAAEKMPIYGNSETDIMIDLVKNIRYPEKAWKNNVQGKVIVKFVVTKEGKTENFSIAQSVDPDLDEEAISAIKRLPGKWRPATINGKAVDCYYNVPVTFKLQN